MPSRSISCSTSSSVGGGPGGASQTSRRLRSRSFSMSSSASTISTTLSKHVRPVLAEKCLKCHGGKATKASFDLSDRERLLKGGESGPAVLPGKGKDSLLYKLVAHQKEPFMPHEGKKLPDDLIARVAEWI